LAVIDDFSRKNLALVADTSLSDGRVARELTALVERYGKPLMIVSDNGTEFTSLSHARQVLADWREDYNTVRPHSQLDGRTPDQVARQVSRGHAPETLVIPPTPSHKKRELSF
ncbi:integrase core domain-containing protein, partial [Gluconobacter kondonii]|uniref:integrase core domain-containing protein n=1 Tax=Gluconobacter kondonii TaxID=941463 RepID=UPI0020112A0D